MSHLISTVSEDRLEHVPGPPELNTRNKFQSQCACGYAGKETDTPTHAYNSTKVHADHANTDRDAAQPRRGYEPASHKEARLARQAQARAVPAPRSGSGAAGGTPAQPRAPRPSRGGSRPCGCGCGGTTGGRYCPGHDARHLGNLQRRVAAGELSAADAISSLADQPNLQKKLAGRLAS